MQKNILISIGIGLSYLLFGIGVSLITADLVKIGYDTITPHQIIGSFFCFFTGAIRTGFTK